MPQRLLRERIRLTILRIEKNPVLLRSMQLPHGQGRYAMGLDMEEDLASFDPRAFWAEKNNEYIRPPSKEKRNKFHMNHLTHEEKVRKFLRTNEGKLWTAIYQPMTMDEISNELGLPRLESEWTLNRLKKFYRVQIGRGLKNSVRTYFTINRDLKNIWL